MVERDSTFAFADVACGGVRLPACLPACLRGVVWCGSRFQAAVGSWREGQHDSSAEPVTDTPPVPVVGEVEPIPRGIPVIPTQPLRAVQVQLEAVATPATAPKRSQRAKGAVSERLPGGTLLRNSFCRLLLCLHAP